MCYFIGRFAAIKMLLKTVANTAIIIKENINGFKHTSKGTLKSAEYIKIIQLVSITKLLEPVYLFFADFIYHPLAIFYT